MEKKLDSSRSANQSPLNQRKGKRRSSRKSNLSGSWMNNSQNDLDGNLIPNIEYSPRMLWQASIPSNMHDNEQRLFTAVSDPTSVCGYSPMPVTYAMQPVSLPTMYRVYHPVPLPDPRTTRTTQNRIRHDCNNHSINPGSRAKSNVTNGNLQVDELDSPVHIAYRNGDYTSLPSTANKNNGINGDKISSEHRRYSDPGFSPADDLPQTDSDDSDSIESGSSITTIDRSNKLVVSLVEQVTELKKCNSQLFKDLSETKSDLENIKVKLTQCKHSSSSDYQPGMLSEFIHEIREANKNCEEALIAKVKSTLEEKYNQQSIVTDELQNQLLKLIKEKEESNKRVAELEREVAALKLNATNEGREIAAFEEETLALRRELQEARASRTLAENHAAKLEKLVGILHKKMNSNTSTETANIIRDVLATGICSIPGDPIKVSMSRTSSSSSKEEEDDNENDNNDDSNDDNDNDYDDEDDDDIDNENRKSSTNDQNPSTVNDPKIPSATGNNVNLSGPVTDL